MSKLHYMHKCAKDGRVLFACGDFGLPLREDRALPGMHLVGVTTAGQCYTTKKDDARCDGCMFELIVEDYLWRDEDK